LFNFFKLKFIKDLLLQSNLNKVLTSQISLYLTTIQNFYIKKLTKNENINKKKKQKVNIKISFIVKSKGITFLYFFDKPKTELNQHLLKPIKPKTLAMNIRKKQENIEISKNPLNM